MDLSGRSPEFRQRKAPLQAEVSSLGDPSICATLTRRGFVLANFESVLGRPLPLAEATQNAPGIEVSVADESSFSTWLDTVVTGFATPDIQGVPSHESFPREVLERVITDMTSAEGFLHYLARRHGDAAGGATMRLCDGIAQLCGSATLPEQRRRGVQTALLGSRLADAGREGCDVAVVTTQPGSKSQQNVQRQGFELLYLRAILVRDPE